MNRVRLVTFDVTNCLLGFRRSLNDTYSEIAAKHGLYLKPSQRNQIMSAFKASYGDVNMRFPCFGAQHGLSGHDWWRQVLINTFRKVGVVGESERLERVFNSLYHHFETSAEWAVDEGVQYLLPELRQHGLKLGVITNFDSRIFKILKNVGISDLFDFIVTSQEARVAKPNPEIFDYAAKKAGIEDLELREKWLHVGSDCKIDILGAKRAGLAYAIRYSCQKDCDVRPAELESASGVLEVKKLAEIDRLLFHLKP